MIKIKHIFHDNTNISGNGKDYYMENKSADSAMIVSCGDLNNPSTATSATITFYGKAAGSNEYVAMKAIKVSDYTLHNTGDINESYLIDCSSYDSIRVALSDADGNVTVVGEVVE